MQIAFGKGKVKLGPYLSIRKLMRAARRGLLPAENLRAIEDASTEKALMRHAWYRIKKARERSMELQR